MAKETEPCRIYAILARSAPVGVIFRRGPSPWVQVLSWNLVDDTFEQGQWIHGHIHEFSCDLSPNGRYLLYRANKRQRFIWTAISRTPYVKALALWEHDSWGGGGFFVSDQEVLLSFGKLTHPPTIPENGDPVPTQMRFDAYSGGQNPYVDIFNARLHQHGWRETEVQVPDEHDRGTNDPVRWTPQHFIKGDGPGGRFQLTWSMFRWSHPAFGIHDRERKTVAWLPADTEWADWDYRHRLVWAREGKIWAMSHPSSFAFGQADAEMLIDLNANHHQSIISPEWARHW